MRVVRAAGPLLHASRRKTLEETDELRYFVAKDEKTYFYIKDKALFDYSGKELSVKASFDTDNGTVYQTDRVIPARVGAYSETGKMHSSQIGNG